MLGIRYDPESVLRGLLSEQSWALAGPPMEQLSLFNDIDLASLSSRQTEVLNAGSTFLSGKNQFQINNKSLIMKEPLQLESKTVNLSNIVSPNKDFIKNKDTLQSNDRFMKGERIKCLTGQI